MREGEKKRRREEKAMLIIKGDRKKRWGENDKWIRKKGGKIEEGIEY